MRQAPRPERPPAGHSEVQLGGSELHVVAPLRLWVVLVRDGGHQTTRMGVREVEDVRGRQQAATRERWVAAAEDLGGQGQRRGIAPGQIGTEMRARRAGAEHGAMPDVAVHRVPRAPVVVTLRQAPEIVVARRPRIAGPDPDLVVQRPRLVVPHAQQPARPELRLGAEVGSRRRGAHLVREVTHPGEQQRLGVARGVHELEVVASVPPAARGVDALAHRRQIAAELAVAVDLGGPVRHGAAVVQMRGRRAQPRTDELRAVTLDLVEAERIAQRLSVDVRAAADGE